MTQEEWSLKFSNKLLELLKTKGMTQRELAEKSGLTEVSVSRYVTMQRIPNGVNIVNMSKALGCKVSELVDFEGEM